MSPPVKPLGRTRLNILGASSSFNDLSFKPLSTALQPCEELESDYYDEKEEATTPQQTPIPKEMRD
jgi:hypothetical protein